MDHDVLQTFEDDNIMSDPLPSSPVVKAVERRTKVQIKDEEEDDDNEDDDEDDEDAAPKAKAASSAAAIRKSAALSAGTASGNGVFIRKEQRSKHKHITSVKGMDLFGCDLKKVAKACGQSFRDSAPTAETPPTEGCPIRQHHQQAGIK